MYVPVLSLARYEENLLQRQTPLHQRCIQNVTFPLQTELKSQNGTKQETVFLQKYVSFLLSLDFSPQRAG